MRSHISLFPSCLRSRHRGTIELRFEATTFKAGRQATQHGLVVARWPTRENSTESFHGKGRSQELRVVPWGTTTDKHNMRINYLNRCMQQSRRKHVGATFANVSSWKSRRPFLWTPVASASTLPFKQTHVSRFRSLSFGPCVRRSEKMNIRASKAIRLSQIKFQERSNRWGPFKMPARPVQR